MRALFLLLLLLNIGYFVWQWQQPSKDDLRSLSGGPIAVAPGTTTLTLLSEVHAPPAAEKTPPDNNAVPETPPAPAAPQPAAGP